jgi:hypothetical protein
MYSKVGKSRSVLSEIENINTADNLTHAIVMMTVWSLLINDAVSVEGSI